ncbi:anti-sigma factor antagonist [Heliobacterium gestii]|uniref:Anti-sigma factor antagonist n=1 Tax=Heliomicrobium gestii TaxID=2699 RepID=A0A845L4S2_HELGE|nr:STAS domain-containing protein [Heliomicrobium gestii]MBM7865321.1 anti-anti-sigma factor [Heliomicrobium gestii]MZP41582.1 anti-sigma factor antagonist [Heliomicrobium gestii]
MLEYRTRKLGSCNIVDLQGEIDGLGLERFKKALTEAVTEKCEAIVLNFTDVVFISSSGLGALVAYYKQLQSDNLQLSVFGLRDVIRQVFEIVRLNKVIAIVDSEEDALALVSAAKE